MLSVLEKERRAQDFPGFEDWFDPDSMDTRLVSFTPEKLKGLRNAKKLSQAALAELADLTHPIISMYESGKINPTEEALRKLGRALDVVFVADWQDESWVKETPRAKRQRGEIS